MRRITTKVKLMAMSAILFFVSLNAKAQVLSYTTDTGGVLNMVATNATGTNLTRVNGALHPSAICSAGGFEASNFSAVTSYSTTLGAIQTTVTANSGYSLSVTGFSVDIRRSSTGPANVRFAYSTDGGTTWIDQGTDQNPNNGSCGATITATWPVSFTVASPNTLKFNIFGFNASGTGGTFQVMNLNINGTVVSVSGCAVPTGLSVSGITTTSATLNWTAVTGATSYNIQYRPVGSTTWSTATSTSASCNLTGLTCGTTYEFQVQTVCASGSSAFTASTTFTTSICTCPTPTGLSASSITTNSATLNWTAATGAMSYNIQYRQTGTTTWSPTTTTATSVNITGLSCGTTYEFQVQTVCSGTSSSPFTTSTTFTTVSCACPTPTGLSATAVTTTTATLNWSAVTGALSYNLQYRQTGTTTWTTGTTTSTTYPITGLTCGTTYEFQVQAVCSITSTGAFSSSTTFTTTACACPFPTTLSASSITTTSATLNWSAVISAAYYNLHYRKVGTTTWTTDSTTGTSYAISGLTCGTTYEFQVQTVCLGAGTGSYSSSFTFTTAACVYGGSSGRMAIYFNMPVDNTVSTGVNAVYLNNCIADTIVAYINRAKYSIDIAQYDYNQSTSYANIATAINNAYLSGKRVRWIYDGSSPNTGLTSLNAGIHTLGSPVLSCCIMHDKFMVIDANSTNADDAIVLTGSADWSLHQFNTSPNNFIFIQDSALAHVYTQEFNMMWGDTGVAPNTTLSKFNTAKTDLGRHSFNIAGRTVELYFSPSDNSNSHIVSAIHSANTDMYFGVYDFTQWLNADTVVARHTAGVYTAGIVDQFSNTSSAYPILTSGLGTNLKTFVSSTDVYHNKMIIVDPSNFCSDPLVETGSENWTSAGSTGNDENIIIIHNDTVANIYYQSFKANFASLGGSLTTIANCSTVHANSPTFDIMEDGNSFKVFPNPSEQATYFTFNLSSDANISLSIYNIVGQKVAEVMDKGILNQGEHKFVATIPNAGVYFVKLTIGEMSYTKKIIKL